MDERLEFGELYTLIKKRATMIFLIVIGAVVLAAVFSYYVVSPMYEGSTQILISQGAEGGQTLTENDVQADLQLVNTYRGLIESPVIMGKVIEQLGLDTTVNNLKKQFTVNSSSESQLIEIAVTDKSQRRAADIANTTAVIFQEEVKTIMNADNVKILFPAEVFTNAEPVSPNPLLNMAIAAGLGLIIGLGLAILLSYLDTTIKNERDVEKYLEVPVLAVMSPLHGSQMDEESLNFMLQEKEA